MSKPFAADFRLVEENMSDNIAQLEQAWLAAEAKADEAKREVKLATEQLRDRNTKVVDAAEIKMLTILTEQARTRQAEADKQASAAFDALWVAKGQGQHSLHA